MAPTELSGILFFQSEQLWYLYEVGFNAWSPTVYLWNVLIFHRSRPPNTKYQSTLKAYGCQAGSQTRITEKTWNNPKHENGSERRCQDRIQPRIHYWRHIFKPLDLLQNDEGDWALTMAMAIGSFYLLRSKWPLLVLTFTDTDDAFCSFTQTPQKLSKYSKM